jgi:hypothetical protein
LIAASPHFNDDIQDFKHDDRQSDESALRTHARALHDFQDAYDEQNAPSIIQQIHHDFYRGQHASVLLQKLHELTGHDGMIRKFDNGVEHHVAWFPEQVKVAHAKFEKFGAGTKIQESSEEHPMIDVDGVMKHRHNSEGKPIHPTDDGIRNFHRWFEDSKVVDKHGRPQVMYHGTNRDFKAFSKNVFPNFNTPQDKIGFFFTKDTTYANQYTGDHGHIMPVFLKSNSPKYEDVSVIDKIENGTRQYAGTYVSKLKKSGYDSVSFGDVEHAVFHPSQIKSAIGNDGSFDHPTKIHEDVVPANITANIPTEPVVTKKKQREILSFKEYNDSIQRRD